MSETHESEETNRLRTEITLLRQFLDLPGTIPSAIVEARAAGLAALERILSEEGEPAGEWALDQEIILPPRAKIIAGRPKEIAFGACDPIFISPYFRGSDAKRQNVVIEFTGVPNKAMLPMNDRAGRILAAWLEAETPWVSGSTFRFTSHKSAWHHAPVRRYLTIHRSFRAKVTAAAVAARGWIEDIFFGPARLRRRAAVYDHPSSIRRRAREQKPSRWKQWLALVYAGLGSDG